MILDHSVMSRRGDSIEPESRTELDPQTEKSETKVDAMDGVEPTGAPTDTLAEPQLKEDAVPSQDLAHENVNTEESAPLEEDRPNINVSYKRHPTPILSEEDQQLPLAQGGIQWYMQPFDPIGTTIHEERWTGRDVMRGMSEELSELDEDELKDLVDDVLDQTPISVTAPRSQQKVRRTRRLRG